MDKITQVTNEIKIKFRETDNFPVAVVAFIDGRKVQFSNAKFQEVFINRLAADDARLRADPAEVFHNLKQAWHSKSKKAASFNIAEGERLGARDYFYRWQDGDDAEHFCEIQYPRSKHEGRRQPSPSRHFKAWMRPSADDKDRFFLFLEDITSSWRARDLIARQSEGLTRKLKDTLIHQRRRKSNKTPSHKHLEYLIEPQDGRVGGDFVFDWPVRQIKAEKDPRIHITMIGDAAQQSTVGGMMASLAGRVLKEVCKKPREVLRGATNPAQAMALHVNREIVAENTTGSAGIDGMILATDLDAEKLHYCEGSFTVYLLEDSVTEAKDIRVLGDKHKTDQKAFGVILNPEFKADTVEITDNNIVIALTDGAEDLLDRQGLKTTDIIIDALAAYREKSQPAARLKNLQQAIAIRVLAPYSAASGEERLPTGDERLQRRSEAAVIEMSQRRDDVLVVALCPIRRARYARE